jgi:hypothetical protein
MSTYSVEFRELRLLLVKFSEGEGAAPKLPRTTLEFELII